MRTLVNGNMKLNSMKRYYLAILATSIGLFGCQMEEATGDMHEAIGDVVDFHATIDDEDMSKTTLDEHKNVRWSENDQIVIFRKTTIGSKYQVKNASVGKTTASFSLVSSDDDFNAGSALQHNVALYPYSDDAECVAYESDYKVNFNFPSEQTYALESFGNNAFPMVAVSTTNSITFRNVGGGIKLSLKGSGAVASIKIEGKNGEKLSGNASVIAYHDAGKPEISMADDALSYAVLNCAEGVVLKEDVPTSFIIALPPTLFSKGFKVTVLGAEGGSYTIETDKSNEVLRSSLLIMPEVSIEASDLSSPSYDFNEDQYITYVDNYQMVPSGDSFWDMRPFFKSRVSDISEIELKFHMSSLGGYLFSAERPGGNYVYVDSDGLEIYYSEQNKILVTWDELGVDSSDCMVVNISVSKGTITVNGNEVAVSGLKSFSQIEYLFSSYYYVNDDGYAKVYNAVPVGSKLYYAKIWSRSGELCYHGYAAQGTYTDSSLQYAWKSVYNGEQIKYEFPRTNFQDFWVYSYSSSWKHFEGGIDAENMYIESIKISPSKLNLEPGFSYTLSASFTPFYATDKKLTWESSDPSVASVDQNGTVTVLTVGSAVITVSAVGGATATCPVRGLGTNRTLIDYIDEYGVNRGKGIAIDDVIWAPYNCGYHPNNYPYGKLYQWGRKYGQGYSTSYDKDVPVFESGPTTVEAAQYSGNKNVFYTGTSASGHWTKFNNSMWNDGTFEKPEKSINDPCPFGWRVPTYAEFKNLTLNRGSVGTENGISGIPLSGPQVYSEEASQIFVPFAGYRDYSSGAVYRGSSGMYWVSTRYNEDWTYLDCFFISSVVNTNGHSLLSMNYGASVRCVQDESQLVKSVTLDKIKASILKGQTLKLKPTVLPSADQITLEWRTSDSSVATVDEDGTITGVSAGSTYITVVADCVSESCLVTVTQDGSDEPTNGSYTLQLSPSSYGWKKSTTVSNPDATLYDGVYESTNKGYSSTQSFMYIDISGYETFKFYVRSYAETTYDFVVVSNLDCTLTGSTTSGSNVKMTTSGRQNATTAISGYTLVEFTGIDKGNHRITVMYRKDSSVNSNDDKGYILIPKNQ